MLTELGGFLRIASISVAGYDFLITLPVEWRIYRSPGTPKFRWSASRVLFVLIRYVSIALLTISNVGYFYHGFSAGACAKYYLVPSVLKVAQIMISQAIVGYRTWNITRRSTDMGIFLLVFGTVVTGFEWYANLDSRIPVQKDGNCSPGNSAARVPQWTFYLVAMIFDATTILLSSFFLIKSASGISGMISTLKMLLYDGLGYVVVLTGINTLNLITYWNSIDNDVQSSGASLGYVVVWIMSQGILIHIHEAAEARAHHMATFGATGRGMMYNVRTGKADSEDRNRSLDVQVQIERAVMVDDDRKPYQESRGTLNRERSDITNGKTSSADQGEWELSSVVNTAATA